MLIETWLELDLVDAVLNRRVLSDERREGMRILEHEVICGWRVEERAQRPNNPEILLEEMPGPA